MENFFGYHVKNNKNQEAPLSEYKGKLILVVNVASQCGFTPQYTGLEKLFKTYQDQGLVILGFPCNQFGFQEPGSDEEIQNFCKSKYDVSFPVFAKVDVNGDSAAPVYKFLKKEAPGVLGTEAIKWNFTKFLVGRDGLVIRRYSPNTTPSEIETDIKKYL